jgi:AraC-like DNA-binding protein
VRVFAELGAAAAWVGGRAFAHTLDAVISEASGMTPVVAELRRWLAHHLHDAELRRAAAAIGRAPRSLQRELRAVATSFQRELDAARVRRAQQLLAASDTPLTEVAYDVGCASPQHFSTLFRRVAGMTPSAWCAHQRATHAARHGRRNVSG